MNGVVEVNKKSVLDDFSVLSSDETVESNQLPDQKILQTGYHPHAGQLMVHEAMRNYRFTVLVCHRRWGKTVMATHALADSALRCTKPNGRYAYLAPYLKQAKQIAWMYLKGIASTIPNSKKHEGELYVEFPNGARITLYGGDNSEAMRGLYMDGIVIDEPSDIKSHVWGEIIRPALADRKNSWALFIGTPKGINSFYDMYTRAQSSKRWLTFLFRADETNLPWLTESELEAVREELSDNQYRQEFLCDFNASSDDIIIPIDLISEAMKRAVPNEEYLYGLSKVVGVDVARFGDDRSCIVKRWGHFMYRPTSYDKLDNMQLVGKLTQIEEEFKPQAYFIDGGRGEGVIDRLRQLVGDSKVIEVNFGGKATDEQKYADKRTEMYFEMHEWLARGGVLPDDHNLKAELSAPTYKFNSNGKRIMAPKSVTKEFLGRSPDVADASVLTFAYAVVPEESRVLQSNVKINRGDYSPHKGIWNQKKKR